MIRNLIIIAVASFILTLACFAGVAAIGGHELRTRGWTIPAALDDDDNFRISIHGDEDEGPHTTRDLTWTGGEELRVDVPAEVSFTQGDTAKVTVSGPQGLVDRLVVVDGALRFRDEGPDMPKVRINRGRMVITIVAPGVKRFVINGSPSVSVQGYDQPDMTVEINGSGSLSAGGKTQTLAVAISGSGDAELGGLQARDATVSIAGSGDAELNAIGAAQVTIAGSGDVKLLTKPASLSSNIDGSGDLHLP